MTTENENKLCELSTIVETEIDELPPSVNAIWRSSHKGFRVFKTTEAKKWQEKAIKKLKENKTVKEPFENIATMLLEIHTKTKRRMDIDNRIKAIQDCLAPAEIIKDDSQIWELNVKRMMSDRDHVKIKVSKKEEITDGI